MVCFGPVLAFGSLRVDAAVGIVSAGRGDSDVEEEGAKEFHDILLARWVRRANGAILKAKCSMYLGKA